MKLQKTHVFGMFALLGILFAMLRFSLALTAFVPQNQPVGYVSQDEVTNFDLTGGGETLFRTEYKRDYWGGNLFAYPVDAAGTVQTGSDRWVNGAKDHIDAQNFDTGRFIATMKDDGTKIAFRSTTLSATQQTALVASINGTTYTAANIVNFLRGDRSNEGVGTLRQRSTVLGDIVHSRPYYIADTTNPTVFVGSNDGMLHAINTTNGTERWAYVPSMLISKLKTLAYSPADSALPFAHDYFVDGQINIANVTISGASHRILVGGLGAGGKGLYALDITGSTGLAATDEATVAGKILWEITPTKVNYLTPTVHSNVTTAAANATAYNKLGYTYGTPTIAKINYGGTAMDVVIIGNGYNEAATGESYLYVINAATGALVRAIQAGTAGAANPNGLSNPVALDTNADGYVDRVYAGDLNGTMWKFDLSSTTVSSWSASVLLVTSPAQPITSTPGVAVHPNGGYMVSFGTGKIFTGTYGTYNHTSSAWTTASTGDLGDNSVHYVYGIWDGAPVANTALLSQTLTERSYTYGGITTRVRRVTANVPNWSSGATNHKGWKVALPAGERVLGEGSFTENGRFYFIAYNPTVVPYLVPGTSTDIYGENWLLELNYLSGGSSTSPFLDMDSNLLLNDADRIVYKVGDVIPSGKVVGDPILSPSQDGIPVGKWLSNGVQSQPILVQLQTLNTTLFNQNPDVIFPATTSSTLSRGVAGGHFDVDNFYGTNNNCTGVSSGGGSKASGTISFTYSGSKDPGTLTVKVGGVTIASGSPGNLSVSDMARWIRNNNTSSTYSVSRSSGVVTITANNTGTTYNGTITLTYTGTNPSNTIVNAAGGTGGGSVSSISGTQCDYVKHVHEYDDMYDKTGVNMLNASQAAFNLSTAITSTSTNFKVLMMNQYLSPAVSLHIGNSSYSPTSTAGYVGIKNYQTAANLDIATVTTYNRSTIGSLAINMPVDAFAIKDWWGSGDLRVGLHSVSPGCAWSGSDEGADLYQPVIPPADGTDGPGSTGVTTGARHGGALTVQIIKDTTPASAIEENVTGRPQYGYRVKHVNFYDYVLAEYIFYWHHPRNMCYDTASTAWKKSNNKGDAWNTVALMTGSGWTKAPPEDNAVSTANSTPASGSTDPKVGVLGSGVGCTPVTTVVGAVTTTTTTCTDGSKTVVQQTANSNGTVTMVTTIYDTSGAVLSAVTSVVANASGSIKTGGDEDGEQARTGRVSWHELIRQ